MRDAFDGLLGEGLEDVEILRQRWSNALGHELGLCLGKPTTDPVRPQFGKLDGCELGVVALAGVDDNARGAQPVGQAAGRLPPRPTLIFLGVSIRIGKNSGSPLVTALYRSTCN